MSENGKKNVDQSSKRRPQISCFVHNTKIFSLLSQRRKFAGINCCSSIYWFSSFYIDIDEFLMRTPMQGRFVCTSLTDLRCVFLWRDLHERGFNVCFSLHLDMLLQSCAGVWSRANIRLTVPLTELGSLTRTLHFQPTHAKLLHVVIFLSELFTLRYLTVQFHESAPGLRSCWLDHLNWSVFHAPRQGGLATLQRARPSGVLGVGRCHLISSLSLAGAFDPWHPRGFFLVFFCKPQHLVVPRCTGRWARAALTVRRTDKKSLVRACLPEWN